MLAPTSKWYFYLLIYWGTHHLPSLIGKVATAGCRKGFHYYLLSITYYPIETPQSLRDSSPTSGAKWLILTYSLIYYEQIICRGEHCSSFVTVTNNYTMGEHQHFCFAKTNLSDLPINLSVQYACPLYRKLSKKFPT